MTPRRAELAVLLLGVTLVLPSLRAGFFADDYVQIAGLEGWSAHPVGPLDLYAFVPRDRAAVAALVDRGAPTSPRVRITSASSAAEFCRWPPRRITCAGPPPTRWSSPRPRGRCSTAPG